MLVFHDVVPPPRPQPDNPTKIIYPTMNPTIKPTTKPTVNWYYLSPNETGVVDSGTSHIYISPSAPHGPPDTTTLTVRVGTPNGQVQRSSVADSIPIPQLKNDFHNTGHIMPNFTNTLIAVGPI